MDDEDAAAGAAFDDAVRPWPTVSFTGALEFVAVVDAVAAATSNAGAAGDTPSVARAGEDAIVDTIKGALCSLLPRGSPNVTEHTLG
jgi:hypothetical protein